MSEAEKERNREQREDDKIRWALEHIEPGPNTLIALEGLDRRKEQRRHARAEEARAIVATWPDLPKAARPGVRPRQTRQQWQEEQRLRIWQQIVWQQIGALADELWQIVQPTEEEIGIAADLVEEQRRDESIFPDSTEGKLAIADQVLDCRAELAEDARLGEVRP
jgi:hypothetical protein